MEPKWVLTSGQKKIRFRNLLKKRKSEKHNTNDNRQDSETENPSITVSNDSDQPIEEQSQDVVPKMHFRSFSDDTQERKNNIRTVPTLPRERNGNKPPNHATIRVEGK